MWYSRLSQLGKINNISMYLCPGRFLIGYQWRGLLCFLISLLFPAHIKNCDDRFASLCLVVTSRSVTISAGLFTSSHGLLGYQPSLYLFSHYYFSLHDCSCSASHYSFWLFITRSVITSLSSRLLIQPLRDLFGLSIPTLLRHLQPILQTHPSDVFLLVVPPLLRCQLGNLVTGMRTTKNRRLYKSKERSSTSRVWVLWHCYLFSPTRCSSVRPRNAPWQAWIFDLGRWS